MLGGACVTVGGVASEMGAVVFFRRVLFQKWEVFFIFGGCCLGNGSCCFFSEGVGLGMGGVGLETAGVVRQLGRVR